MENPVSEPVLTPVQVPELKTKFPVIYLVLSFLILVFLASTVFLFYQNTQLKNKLTSYQAQPIVSPTPTTYQSPVPTADPTASWKTYKNNTYGFSFKIPENWTNYSMNDFSSQPFTNTEELLYIGPKNTDTKPPQVMQISSYKINAYQEQEVFPPANCTITDVLIGIDQTQAIHKICKGMESNGFITIKTSQFVFIIDELKGSATDYQLFDQILSTFKFTK